MWSVDRECWVLQLDVEKLLIAWAWIHVYVRFGVRLIQCSSIVKSDILCSYSSSLGSFSSVNPDCNFKDALLVVPSFLRSYSTYCQLRLTFQYDTSNTHPFILLVRMRMTTSLCYKVCPDPCYNPRYTKGRRRRRRRRERKRGRRRTRKMHNQAVPNGGPN
jgi:hypothetical protein